MKSFLISDNKDTLIGMKLAGISGTICEDKQSLLDLIEEKIKDPEIGIILVTDKVKMLADSEIMDYKIKEIDTLITEIPSMNSKYKSDYITRYIRESIGVKF